MASDDEIKKLKEQLEEQRQEIDAVKAQLRKQEQGQEVEQSVNEANQEARERFEKQEKESELEKEQLPEVEVDLENEQMPDAGIDRDEEMKKNEIGNEREDMFSEALPTHSHQEVEAIDRQLASEMQNPAQRSEMYEKLGIEQSRQELYDEQLSEAAKSIEQALERTQQQENEHEQTR